MYLEETKELRKALADLTEESKEYTNLRNIVLNSSAKKSIQITLADFLTYLPGISVDNWDSEGAKKIKPETALLTVRFILYLNKWIESELRKEISSNFSITGLSDGTIDIQWKINDSLHMLVNIKDDGTIGYSCNISGDGRNAEYFSASLFNEEEKYRQDFLDFFTELLVPKQKADELT